LDAVARVKISASSNSANTSSEFTRQPALTVAGVKSASGFGCQACCIAHLSAAANAPRTASKLSASNAGNWRQFNCGSGSGMVIAFSFPANSRQLRAWLMRRDFSSGTKTCEVD